MKIIEDENARLGRAPRGGSVTLRIHQVSCSHQSGPPGSDDHEHWTRQAQRLERYARRLGFDVLYEAADDGDKVTG